MTEPTDIRDETCTHLAMLLSLLIRKIKPNETISLLATKKQMIQVKDTLSQQGFCVCHESLPEDLLIMITKPD